jgi:predicted CXXCH cytochrome family protein
MSGHPPDDPITKEIRRLQRPMAGRRSMSWLLFIGAVVVFLVAPMLASLHGGDKDFAATLPVIGAMLADPVAKSDARLQGRRPDPLATPDYAKGDAVQFYQLADMSAYKAASPTLMALDRWWNPGPLALAHKPWAHDCRVCHGTPFARVKDEDCLSCHKAISDHVDRSSVRDARLDARCATCHLDHQGGFALAQQNKHAVGRDCADCHGDIKQSYPETKTEAVKDFADAHPNFRVQLAGAAPSVDRIKVALTRVRLPEKGQLVEPTNLKFPHDVHLDKKGIGSPEGKVVMKCANCHQPDPDGINFKTVNMKDHCQSCHALKMEPNLSNREVPHGSVTEVLDTLAEFYAFAGSSGGVPRAPEPLTKTIVIKRPGQPEQAPRSFVSAPGNSMSRASAAAVELFEKTSCAICHEVKRLAGRGEAGTPGRNLPQWSIAPIAADHAWMPKSEFSHASHASAKCESCHAADTSNKASDVLMPGIDGCRDCHAGSRPVSDKLVSECSLCHGFHMPTAKPEAVPAKPLDKKVAQRVVAGQRVASR